MTNRRTFCALSAAALLPLPALAQAWPGRPIRLVVPFPPGGGTDSTARVVANKLSALLGQSVIVENRVGAAGRIGTDWVAKSPSDGYTLLFAPASYTVDPALHKLSFDPKKDLMPVSLVMTCPNVLVVPPNAPYNNIKEFLAYAAASPGKLTYASSGTGTGQHLSGELFNARTNAKLLHVPYKGGGPALIDLLGGQVSSYFANAASATSYINSNRLKALGVTSAKRMPQLPDVPTFMEQGVPNYETLEWAGILVPAGTPQAVIDRLSKDIQATMKDPDVRSKLFALGVEPAGSTAAFFGQFVDSQMKFWADVVKSNNITAE
jgi:tripartite-type tricarboxylate transporter receptor subunit TctC